MSTTSPPNSQNSPSSLGLREFLGTVVSLSAFATALLYFTGRAYTVNFLQEMNIPQQQISFSIWEYGEVGWLSIAQYLVLTVAYLLLGAIMVSLVIVSVNPPLRWISRRFTRSRAPGYGRSLWPELPGLSQSVIKQMFAVARISLLAIASIALVILILSPAVQDAGQRGAHAGRDAVLNAQHLTLITSRPLDIPGGASIETSQDQVIYRYDGLYVLTYNDKRYFAYRTLGVQVCRPEQVFIIGTEQIDQVILSTRPLNAPNCDR